jgi:FecR protein
MGEEMMNWNDQQRLQGWLDAARKGQDVGEPEHSVGAPGSGVNTDGVVQFGERQRRTRHLRALAELIRSAPLQRLRSRRERWGAMGAAAAAVLALGLGGTALTGWPGADPVAASESAEAPNEAALANLRQVVGKVIATHPGGQNRVIGADTAVAPGDELSTAAEAFASLEAGKARVDLSAATTLRLTELDATTQVFHLQAGRIDISVPRIPGEQRLVRVTTADAKVTVHGTVFSVEVRQDETGPVTTVGVTRGLVAVERAAGANDGEVMLHPGESWNSRSGRLSRAADLPKGPAAGPSETGSSSEAGGPASASKAPSKGRARATSRVNGVRTAEPGPSPVPETRGALAGNETPAEPGNDVSDNTARRTEKGALAEQNRLFELAMRARDRGDDRAAAQQLRQLLSAHPDSPLRSTAQVELSQANRRLAEQP